MKARKTDSCRPLFKHLNILPFYSQYIFSVSMSVVKNMDIFTLNSDIHSIHTRQGSDLHHPTYKLTKIQKGVYCSGIMIFNNLPQNLKNMTPEVNKFKHTSKEFLHPGSFYSLQEYLDWRTMGNLASYK
jgi:hypothetical protein